MCGIVGIFSTSEGDRIVPDEPTLTRMRDMLHHRGPDGAGIHIDEANYIGLAHRRLSIVDLNEAAAQPMTNEDGRIWLVFNGEIYNHLTLRAELEKAGHTFRTTHSDTEVIVHGYEEWGFIDLMNRMSGDWAIALWDSKTGKLHISRDRIGVKPLYFTTIDGQFMFASEIKALLENPKVNRDIDPTSMYHFLSFLTVPAPMTMFKNIFKLAPGMTLTIDHDGNIAAQKYWDLDPSRSLTKGKSAVEAGVSEQELTTQIRDIFRGAVEKRMMADVPVGAFLSGGVDSTATVAMMREFTSRKVNTFTVGFADHQHLNEIDEAQVVANHFSTNHHQILIESSDMQGYLQSLVRDQDEPIADWVCIPLYFLSKLTIDNGVKVVLVGEGADEQFCGYDGYMRYLHLFHRYWKPYRAMFPKVFQKAVAAAAVRIATLHPRLEVYADILDRSAKDTSHFWSGAVCYWETMKDKLVNHDVLTRFEIPRNLRESGLFDDRMGLCDSAQVVASNVAPLLEKNPQVDVLAEMIFAEFKLRLPELLLMRVDKITMSNSIEARVPFLDHELVDASFGIPLDDKIPASRPKHLFKKAMAGIVPDQILNSQKKGFGAPMSNWLKGEFGVLAEDILFSSSLMKRGYFNLNVIRNLFRDHKAGRRDNALYLWSLINLVMWYDYWIDGGASAKDELQT